MDHIGKICPYCKSMMTENDEIVVCSKCGMPHHRQCWIENTQCTTFGCDGAMSSPLPFYGSVCEVPPDAPSTVPAAAPGAVAVSELPEYMFCPQCGLQSAPDSVFCMSCGTKLISSIELKNIISKGRKSSPDPVTQNDQYQPNITNHIPLEVVDFVCSNRYYYKKSFLYMKTSKRYVCWNWSAFYFNVFWLFYRKLYVYAIGTIILVALLDLVNLAYFGFIVSLLLGMFGNNIYMQYVDKHMESLRNSNLGEEKDYIKHHGGTTFIAPIVFSVFTIIIYLITAYFEY